MPRLRASGALLAGPQLSSWCGRGLYLHGIVFVSKAGMLSELHYVTSQLSANLHLWKYSSLFTTASVLTFLHFTYAVDIFMFHVRAILTTHGEYFSNWLTDFVGGGPLWETNSLSADQKFFKVYAAAVHYRPYKNPIILLRPSPRLCITFRKPWIFNGDKLSPQPHTK